MSSDNENSKNMVKKLSNYKQIKIVGQGSYGIAILYKKINNNRMVVLKQINLATLNTDEISMAINEVNIFSKLYHPNIISYLNSFMLNNVLYIEMEYADGGTLAQLIQYHCPNNIFPEIFILNIFKQITNAIYYMHSQNILHRDLKTANVFLSKTGNVKIGDFGISKLMETHVLAQTILGTPYYFSPEMCEGKEYDEKSDIWALGCILNEMCCLKKSFPATNFNELINKIMTANYIKLPCQYSDGIKELVHAIFQINPLNRPSAKDINEYWLPRIINCFDNSQYMNINSGFIKQFNESVIFNSYIDDNKENNLLMSLTEPGCIIERTVLYNLQFTKTSSIVLKPMLLPYNLRIISFSNSLTHFLAVLSDGSVFSWGSGTKGQLGHGVIETWRNYPKCIEKLKLFNIVGCNAGNGISFFWTDNGLLFSCGDFTTKCLGYFAQNNQLTPIFIETLKNHKIIKVVSGDHHVFACSSIDYVFTWGINKYKVLGSKDPKFYLILPKRILIKLPDKIKTIFSGPNASLILLNNNELYCRGINNYNKFNFGKRIKHIYKFKKVNLHSNIIKIKDIMVTMDNCIYLIDSGYVITMGSNKYHQRGLGHEIEVNKPTQVTGIKNKYIRNICANNTYTAVASDDNIVTIWGTISTNSHNNNLLVDNKVLDINTSGDNEQIWFKSSTAIDDKPFIVIPEALDILALYSSKEQQSNGIFIKVNKIYSLLDSLFVLIDTTTPIHC